jgi:hypothetical protein
VDLGPDCRAFERRCDTDRVLCVFNPSPRPLRVKLPGPVVEGTGFAIEGDDLVFPTWGAAFSVPGAARSELGRPWG